VAETNGQNVPHGKGEGPSAFCRSVVLIRHKFVVSMKRTAKGNLKPLRGKISVSAYTRVRDKGLDLGQHVFRHK